MRLIDADALIEDIKTKLWDWDTVDGITATTVLKQTITDIGNAPTIDAVPVRHGHWVESFKVNAPPTLRSRWICSWCGNVQTYGATDYCPNCGARMDGDSDE